MENKTLHKLETAADEFLNGLSSCNEEQFNKIPFEGSWTTGQLADHVTRSMNGMGEALGTPGKMAGRDPEERVAELKSMFLNFESKMKSPVFILPTRESYDKQIMTDKFKSAVKHFTETGKEVNLTEMLSLPPLGDLTKTELIHFTLYHTQRHTHQLKKILAAL